MRLRVRLEAMIGIAALACGCSGRYVYGEQADRIKVSHAKHIKASVDCTTCHDKVWDAIPIIASRRTRSLTCAPGSSRWG